MADLIASFRDRLTQALSRAGGAQADNAAQVAGQNGQQGFSPAMLGPFGSADLRPLAEGWQVGGPAFVGVGVGKSGTSWWYSLLIRHPRIVRNRLRRKELHYFDHLKLSRISDAQIETYRQAFAAPAGGLCGEWTPNYLNWPMAIENLARAAPDSRVLVILRNPVDRTLSGINQQHTALLDKFGFDRDARYVYETYTLFPRTITNSLYSAGLRRLLRAFGREQVLVLQYEQCKRDPAVELARTYRFLEVDDAFRPGELTRPVHRVDYVVPKFDETQRRLLADYFRDDVDATLGLFPELDLTLWEDFRT